MKKPWQTIIKLVLLLVVAAIGSYKTIELQTVTTDDSSLGIHTVASPAGEVLASLPIKGRAPKTGYERAQFGNGWMTVGSCDTRNIILARDLIDERLEPDGCSVSSGLLHDPYSGAQLGFVRGPETSDDIQIDHVVALSDAWQKGAQQLSYEERVRYANDPYVLLAVDGGLNQQKGDGDAATWLPPNKAFRCQYVARQIGIKRKYSLWMTRSEYDAVARVLQSCPEQTIPN